METATLTTSQEIALLSQKLKKEQTVLEQHRQDKYGGGAYKSVIHGETCDCQGECVNGQGIKIPYGTKAWVPENRAARVKCEDAGDASGLIIFETHVEKRDRQDLLIPKNPAPQQPTKLVLDEISISKLARAIRVGPKQKRVKKGGVENGG